MIEELAIKINELKRIVKKTMLDYEYHNYGHALDVYNNVKLLAKLENITSKDRFLLEISALFHDIIYVPFELDNEEKSAEYTEECLSNLNYTKEDIAVIKQLILATEYNYIPTNILEMIIKDADTFNIGTSSCLENTDKLAKENELTRIEQYKIALMFFNNHKFYTSSAKKLLDNEKQQNISELQKKIDRVLVAGWSLTRQCNLRCMHCYSASGKRGVDELTTTECHRVVDKLNDAGVVAINFGGGECALRPDFIDICKYIYDKGILISYTTNGTTFDLIKDYLYLFHDIGVSIDFADKDKHDRFRGGLGVYEKAISTLKYLVKHKISNEMVTCLTKLNCSREELSKLYELGKQIGIDSWRINRFRSNGRGVVNEGELKLSISDMKNSYSFLNELRFNKKILTPEPIFRSAFGGTYYRAGDPSGFSSFRILSNGEVSPSVFLSESGGNIKQKSIEEILDSEIFRTIRNRKPKGKCRFCPAYYHCKGGDVGASYLKYGHFNGPDPLCFVKPEEVSKNIYKSEKKEWNIHELYLCTLYIPIVSEEE